MRTVTRRLLTVTAVGLAGALALTGCSHGGSGGGTTTSSTAKTLVVDNSFDLKTSDPARAFELTGSIVDHAIYQTALTFDGSDVTKPVPQLTTYTISSDDKVVTLTLNGKNYFSNGDPVTIDDIVWSLKRVQGINGNPSFLLAGETIAKVNDTTLTLTSKTPNPALPFILPNPSLGILDSKVVEQHGGSDTASDKAESYLNATSEGSGPYELGSYNVNTKVVLVPNPHYAGTAPAYGRVVLQNVSGASQKVDVQGGNAQLALDLNSDQVAGLNSGSTQVISGTSPDLAYLWFNQNPSVSQGVTNNPQLLLAIKHAIQYSKILSVSGSGSEQPGGIVPSQFLGAIKPADPNVYDPAAAKAELKSSGYSGQTITFSYPSDDTLNGLSFQTLAETLQASLQTAGINLKLSPLPIATLLDQFRAGKLQAGIMYWGPDFPDPSDYTVFSPNQELGLRAGWTSDPAVEAKLAVAEAAAGAARGPAYEAWQRQSNLTGPFVPLLQTGQNVVAASSISGSSIQLNPVWTIDLSLIK